jgi:hypothetical protein
MDAYQPIYDAVRSRLSNGDIGQAVEAVMREANVAHYVERAAVTITEVAVRVADAHAAPSAVYRPAMLIDGNQWCALYGANLQDGVAGFGDSPADAMRDFDSNWARSQLESAAEAIEDARSDMRDAEALIGALADEIADLKGAASEESEE